MRERRRQLGLTLHAVAERAGCTKSYLSSLENDDRARRPSDDLLGRLESALRLSPGSLVHLAHWHSAPVSVRAEVAKLAEQQRAARQLVDALRRAGNPANNPRPLGARTLDEVYRSGELRRLIERIAPEPDPAPNPPTPERGVHPHPSTTPGRALPCADGLAIDRVLPLEVPVINKVAAGYPTEFTDMGYPARVADDYVRTPDVRDPDAFAARVVGDSMEPLYREGDIVVFSPAKPIPKDGGADCFVRLEPDHESTFKRVYFERSPAGAELIRLQPLNPRYSPRTIERERVAGLYAAVSVTRAV
jgi:transcriptional regulator with XRE-family HTH domain